MGEPYPQSQPSQPPADPFILSLSKPVLRAHEGGSPPASQTRSP